MHKSNLGGEGVVAGQTDELRLSVAGAQVVRQVTGVKERAAAVVADEAPLLGPTDAALGRRRRRLGGGGGAGRRPPRRPLLVADLLVLLEQRVLRVVRWTRNTEPERQKKHRTRSHSTTNEKVLPFQFSAFNLIMSFPVQPKLAKIG